MTSMSLLVAVAVALVCLSSTIVAGGDGPSAHRSITMEIICREATAGEPMPMYDLCMGMLGRRSHAGSIHEASEYAFIGAMEAWRASFFTMCWVRDALRNASMPAELKAAYRQCGRGYLEAQAAMTSVWTRLPERCGLDLGDEYRAALRGLGAPCKDDLAKLSDSQLLGKAGADYDRTMVAYLLGKFIGIK